MADVTVDTYSRAITRIAHYFGRCPDELSKRDLKDYFDHFIIYPLMVSETKKFSML